MSIFKSTLVVLAICLTLGFSAPSTTYAAPMTDAERIELIASLRLQIIELLKQLIALRTGQAVVTEVPSHTNQDSSSGSSSNSGNSSHNNSHEEDEAELVIEIATDRDEVQTSDSSVTYKVDVTAMESDFTFIASANTTLVDANVSVTTSADKSGNKYKVDEGETQTITVKVTPSNGFTVGSSFTTTLTINATDAEGNSASVNPITFDTEVTGTEVE